MLSRCATCTPDYSIATSVWSACRHSFFPIEVENACSCVFKDWMYKINDRQYAGVEVGVRSLISRMLCLWVRWNYARGTQVLDVHFVGIRNSAGKLHKNSRAWNEGDRHICTRGKIFLECIRNYVYATREQWGVWINVMCGVKLHRHCTDLHSGTTAHSICSIIGIQV